ncbi:MAG TPA: hypothetical protein VMV72_10750 [Verrucomicrobiae bacterium]|nr:hypothetical protein [Verrucomicrobiae bacterium]
MNKQVAMGFVAAIAILGSMLLLVKWHEPPMSFADKLMQGVGEAAVQEVGKLAANRASVVVVQPSDCEACNQTKKLKAAFREIARQKGVHTVATVTVNIISESQIHLSADVYAQVLRDHADAGVIVSLMGFPAPGTEPVANRAVKVLAIVTDGDHDKEARDMLDHRLVDAAIVPLTTRPPGAPQNPTTPAEWFQSNYQLVTP